ncbi:MAG: recombinase family protein [Bradyrhizobium sp.]|nr:recombinase family protein [Bradyrhizobium sp.]
MATRRRPQGGNGKTSNRRAAQYLRMSTDPQKYSIENQAAAIAAWAARRNIRIVRTYEDRGRSGLTIDGREGLQKLIHDVQRGRADFDCILVYDVSRWGRFQDVDESAYYEFICKRAGILIHYCEDDFENDGSLTSIVLKNLKRAGAADYSLQLSKKVFLGQCNVVSKGYWRGGSAGYGLRRLLLDENDRPKTVLQFKQRKNIKSDRIVLVPGPKSEVNVVQRIFTSFAIQKKSRTQIATELNAKRIPNAQGKPWSMLTVSNTLKNEAYIGNVVYNRRSMKLGQRPVRNPPEMWVRRDHAFQPIISPALFAKAQKVMADLSHGRELTDQDILGRLDALRRKKGRLSMRLMAAAKDVPDWTVYARRFGSITNAYKRIGYQIKGRYAFKENATKIDSVIRSVVANVTNFLQRRGSSVAFLPELYLLTLGRNFTVVVTVAWAVADGTTGSHRSRRWQVRQLKYKNSDFILVVRMSANNTKIQDYFLLPTANLPTGRDKRIRISNRVFGDFGYDSLAAVMKALHEQVAAAATFRDRL